MNEDTAPGRHRVHLYGEAYGHMCVCPCALRCAQRGFVCVHQHLSTTRIAARCRYGIYTYCPYTYGPCAPDPRCVEWSFSKEQKKCRFKAYPAPPYHTARHSTPPMPRTATHCHATPRHITPPFRHLAQPPCCAFHACVRRARTHTPKMHMLHHAVARAREERKGRRAITT